ncbi:hypothetical protein ACFXDH_38635 [Streptomyces sp. NPDC059467]|uniref:hypothetical protein n=1 Tax=Streptomyces sp. NPDC059467 TaxID=3346844 RepID=UPI003675754A
MRPEGILVNAVSPNRVPTDANGILILDRDARMPVRMAALPDGGPTGTFICSDGTEEGRVPSR